MNRLFLITALLGLASAASAQTAEPATVEPAASETAAAAPADASTDQDKRNAKAEVDDRNCLKHTGSRLIRADSKGRKCANATGRSYSKEDIDRTGAFDLHDAIRRLDPAVH